MKRIWIALVLLAMPLPAWAAESILNYHTDVAVLEDSFLQVTETIRYDFGDVPKHGIFRDIPKESADGPRIVIGDVVASVDGEPTTPLLENSSAFLHIRLGDPDVTVTGTHTYVISYRVQNAVRYFADRDELYWNAIPGEFDVPISEATVDVTFPAGAVTLGTPVCYTGATGTTFEHDCTLTGGNGTPLRLRVTRMLRASEGMTVAAAIAPGVITRAPEVTEDIGAGWAIVVPILIFVGILCVFGFILYSAVFLRLRLPRKRSDGGRILVEYDPPRGVSPSESGYLASNGADKYIITPAVVQLAIEGWLKLEFTESKKFFFTSRDIIFHRLRDGVPADGAGALVLSLFAPTMEPSKLSDLKSAVRRGELKLQGISGAVRSQLLGDGVLVKSGLWRMFTRPGKEGAAAMEHLAGLKIYIAAAEKERLVFHNAPEHNPQTFEKLLPYAIALGVDEPWRKAFAGVLKEPPDWASGNVGNTAAMMSALGGLTSDISGLVGAYSSGSGGGGSSGGGGGGGGGGSW